MFQRNYVATRRDKSFSFHLFSTTPREDTAATSAVISSSTRKSKPEVTYPYDSKKIRNFSIIAHIDQ